MSENEQFGFKDALNWIQLIVGVILVVLIGVLIDLWNTGREAALEAEYPGAFAYLMMPVYFSVLVFGVIIAFQGLSPITIDFINYLRQPQAE
ncbi:MAG: hypothetical protein ACXAE3_13590 [Candidatus Kariarchaeaceae archaeon]